MYRITLISIIIFLGYPGIVCAQINTDRPDQTESSSTVPCGALQMEIGTLLEFEGNNQPSTRNVLLPTNLFRFGITEHIEFRLLNQFELVKIGDLNHQGISDLEIGTKLQLYKKENVHTEIAFLSHLIVPAGTSEISTDKFGSSNKFCLSHGINEHIGIGYNIGYNYFGEGKGDLTYSLALGIGINEKAGIYIEPYGEFENLRNFTLNVDTGFTYLVKDNIQFDLSFGTGFSQRMNYISIGFSWLLKKE